jgi:hypothetical protein
MNCFLRSAALAVLITVPTLSASAGRRSGAVCTIAGNLALDDAMQIALKQNPTVLETIQ